MRKKKKKITDTTESEERKLLFGLYSLNIKVLGIDMLSQTDMVFSSAINENKNFY